MDTLATFGALVVSEGDTAALALAKQQPAQPDPTTPRDWTIEQRQAVDAVFAAPVQQDDDSPLAAALVTAAGVSLLKGVILDEARRRDEEDEEDEEKPDKRQGPRLTVECSE